MIKPYHPEIEQSMQRFYRTLNEKDRRAYAAVETLKFGYGGVSYIGRVLGCDHKTIQHGVRDLEEPPQLASGRVRRAGGGRKKSPHPRS